jgi:hypothetical protein
MSTRLFRTARRMRNKILTPVLAVGLLAGVLTALVTTAPPASAWVGDFRPATWNMQGGNDNKWNPGVVRLLNQGHDVIALQEAGPGAPGSARHVRNYWLNGYRVEQYTWSPLGSRGQVGTVTILFMQTQGGGGGDGGRVNIALVTRATPRSVMVSRPAFAGSRPALGADVNGTVFWSVHASSRSHGSDAPRLINNMVSISGGRPWAALGDWNREPESWDPGRNRGRRIIRPFTATHQGNHELDYMVVGMWELPRFAVATFNPGGSDHWAVTFGPLRAAADVFLKSAHDGNRALQAGEANEDAIIGSNPPGFNATWQFHPIGNNEYLIRNRTLNQCLEAAPGRNVGLWGGCDRWDRAQKWNIRAWQDSNQLLLVSVNTGGCLADDGGWGWGSHVVTGNCRGGEARWNFGHNYDPPPNAPAIALW